MGRKFLGDALIFSFCERAVNPRPDPVMPCTLSFFRVDDGNDSIGCGEGNDMLISGGGNDHLITGLGVEDVAGGGYVQAAGPGQIGGTRITTTSSTTGESATGA